MPVRMALWKISADKPVPLPQAQLDVESRLEDWIAADTGILGLELLIVGRQVVTAYGGRIDLLAIDQDGNLVILELKRDKTPREIVAQVLDYASWVKDLTPKDIHEIASDHLTEGLDAAFSERFNFALPESLNASHSMVVVATELDESSERIIQYLVNQYGVNINAIFFNFFSDNGKELLGRSWLVDPKTVNEVARERTQPPWPGYWYVNVGEGASRSWEDCRQYGFLSAGGGRKYSDQLKHLIVDAKVFAYQAGRGYVGYGVVAGEAVMARNFEVTSLGKRLFDPDLKLEQPGMKDHSDDPDFSEWVVGVHWFKAVPLSEAKTFKGASAYRNVVCKLRDQKTFDFLKREFEVEEEGSAAASVAPDGSQV